MKLTIPTLLLIGVAMTGCSNLTTFSADQIDSAGNVIEQPIRSTTDSHVAREHDMHQTLRARDKQYRIAYAQSGTKVSFEVKKVNGSDIIFPIVEVKAEPRFEQPLPITPSVHPFWKFGETLLEKGLWGWLGYNFFQFGEKSLESARPVYNGDYSPYQSGNASDFSGMTGNATYQPFTVAPEIVRPEIVYPEVVIPEQTEFNY